MVIEEAPGIDLRAGEWLVALGRESASGWLEWPVEGADPVRASFDLGPVLPGGRSRILEITRAGFFQPVALESSTVGTWRAVCEGCDSRVWRLIAQGGEGRLVCRRCCGLKYASNFYQEREVDHAARDPEGYLRERAASPHAGRTRSYFRTMRMLERARARVLRQLTERARRSR